MKAFNSFGGWFQLALLVSAACGDVSGEPRTRGDTAPAFGSENIPDAGMPEMDIPNPGATTFGGTTEQPGAGMQDDAGTGQIYDGPGKPKCMQKDSQLMVVGDSYINWYSHSFPDDIARESGQHWRMLAVGGYSMATGGLGSIPDEFYNSIALDPDAHTILMDGGGNDILLPDQFRAPFPQECTSKGCSTNPACQEIVRLALNKAGSLMVDAAEKGIRDVVYFFYPHIPANTILSGDSPNEMVDYALPIARKTCADAVQTTKGKLRCTFVDTVPLFEGHIPDWFNIDIHPNTTGSAHLAAYIWQIMSDKCIGQKGPKDCCEM